MKTAGEPEEASSAPKATHSALAERIRANRWPISAAVILSALVLTAYYPALQAGFVSDDWWFLRVLLTKSWPQALIQFFEPRGQFIWYRPLGSALWLLDYALSGTNPTGYHLADILLHLGNCLLLFGLVRRVAGGIRPAFVAATVYATIPLVGQTVLWPSDPQPSATFFYLLCIWFWISHLQSQNRLDYVLAFSFALLAILAKGTSLPLPIALILVDQLLMNKPASPRVLFRRYLPFVALVALYLVPLAPLLTHAGITGQFGYGPGLHLVSNLIRYLALLSFPWATRASTNYIWLVAAMLLVLWTALRRPSRGLAFLVLSIAIMLLPLLPLPYLELRYLYAPVLVVAVFVGLVFELARRRIQGIWFRPVLALSLSALTLWCSANLAEFSAYWAEISRLERLPFRNIAQRHPTFPEDTFLYFLNGSDLAWPTMAQLRYGNNVSVSDIYAPYEARLRDHKNPIVIYIDPRREALELAVDTSRAPETYPALPVEFAKSIRLKGYELTSARAKPGEMIGLILYWQATKKVDKDYTVFVHLVDQTGRMMEGVDGQPREGNSPTSSWPVGTLIPDGRVFLVPASGPTGNGLRLEIGLYYLPTMETLPIVNSRGEPIGNSLVISQLEISQ